MNYENACRLFEFDSSEELTEETIRKKYLKLCLKHHPDKNVGNEESVATFQNLQEAYNLRKQISDFKKFEDL